MRLNPEWRKYGIEYQMGGDTIWLHPKIPSQSSFIAGVIDRNHGFNSDGRMEWHAFAFYILHGFLLDCQCQKDSVLAQYIEIMRGKNSDEMWEEHISHPIVDIEFCDAVATAYRATRDKSNEEPTLDPKSDKDEKAVEKKDKI